MNTFEFFVYRQREYEYEHYVLCMNTSDPVVYANYTHMQEQWSIRILNIGFGLLNCDYVAVYKCTI